MPAPLRGGPRGDTPRELRLPTRRRDAAARPSLVLRRFVEPGEPVTLTPLLVLRELAPEDAWTPPPAKPRRPWTRNARR